MAIHEQKTPAKMEPKWPPKPKCTAISCKEKLYYQISTDDEAEEVKGQEETHVDDAPSTATETQEHAGPASAGSGSHEPVSKASTSTMTHGHWERCPAHTTAEHCRGFHSKQRWFCETSLKVLVESSVARTEHEDAWWDKLCESLYKEDAILEEMRDTMQNLKDMVNKSHAEL
ncbi:hypothetical protein Y1Q_0005307 [Alligator mississippiensis]|uniref:Uncharacterized protein n=1 Tax=Alligator mississippiensis TaxID=8496 RepID=A0A151MTD0_ALLMI|nr:hypothetical protein Y1Q_0005307 [Alligator mississippiensis]